MSRSKERSASASRDEIDYYRLKYQLAAQLLNWHADRLSKKQGPPLADEQLLHRLQALGGGAVSSKGVSGSESDSQAASAERSDLKTLDLPRTGLSVAESLRGDAKGQADRLGTVRSAREMWRQKGLSRWPPFFGPRGLTLKEERRLLFLRTTVEPCAELLAVGAELYLNEAATTLDKKVREVAAKAYGEPGLSYRAHYNVACYYSVRSQDSAGDHGFRKQSLAFLREAVRRCPDHRRQELLNWIELDPSLGGMKSDGAVAEEVTALVRRYRVSEVPPKGEPKAAKADPEDGPSRLEELLQNLRDVLS
jgi:hypothetical protein